MNCSSLIKKKLTVSLRVSDGRTNLGRIASYHRGSGVPRRYRCIDFFRLFDGMPAIVRMFSHDPSRNAKIAVICYYNEVLSSIIAVNGPKIGSIVVSGNSGINRVGNCFRLRNLPSGIFISNVELWPSSGAKYARSLGVSAQLLKQYDREFAIVKFRTGEQRLILSNGRATIGTPASPDFNIARHVIGSAGRNRRLGHRPVVRGVAMNPVDHPHGGAGGRIDKSPWGLVAKGPRTTHQRMLRYIQHKRKHQTRYDN
jgi:large subunit ribosomal protein L2